MRLPAHIVVACYWINKAVRNRGVVSAVIWTSQEQQVIPAAARRVRHTCDAICKESLRGSYVVLSRLRSALDALQTIPVSSGEEPRNHGP